MNIPKKFCSLILKHPKLNLLAIGLFTIVFIFGITQLRVDTSLSSFVVNNDPDLQYYNSIKEIFETDETIIIGFKAPNLFQKETLAFLQSLSDTISNVDHVRNVNSITTANLISTTPDMFEVDKLVSVLPETIQESETIGKHITSNYIYIKDLASLDGTHASIMVDIENATGTSHTKEVVQDIKDILKTATQNHPYTFYIGGDAIINQSLGEYMQKDFFRFIIPTYLALSVLLIFTVGRIRDIIISLVTISITLLWTSGTMGLIGFTFNNVTIGIIPLILCIALEDIYFINHIYYRHLQKIHSKSLALEKTLSEVIAPCFFTSFTTVLGFGSLMINRVKPIIDFGILGSISVMLTFFISIIFISSIHLLLPEPRTFQKFKYTVNLSSTLHAITPFFYKHKKTILIGVPILLIFSFIGISRIKIETDHLNFFHPNSTVYKATRFIEKNIAGISNLEIIVTPKNRTVKDPFVLQEIERLTSFLRELPEIDKAISINDFLKDMNRAMHDNDQSYYRLPETQGAIAQYLLLYSMSAPRNDIEKDFVDYNYALARIRCRTSEHNSKAFLALIDKIHAFIKTDISPELSIRITSYPVIYSNMVEVLASGQLLGLAIAFATMLIAASFYFRSLKIGVLALIPNILPISFTFGMMGWLGFSLNIGTAMTSGIAIGLAMDDTTHVFSHFFRLNAANPGHRQKNIEGTIASIGEPMIFSSVLMITGYLVLVISEFRLTVLFGLLCAITIFIALLSDLIVTPLILSFFKVAPSEKTKRLL